MIWKIITLALSLFFIRPITNCFATTYSWRGSTSTDWATASNWSPSGIPTSTDVVQIGVSTRTLTNLPNVSSGTAAACASIEFGTNNTLSLTVNGTLTVSGDIMQDHPSGSENITT